MKLQLRNSTFLVRYSTFAFKAFFSFSKAAT